MAIFRGSKFVGFGCCVLWLSMCLGLGAEAEKKREAKEIQEGVARLNSDDLEDRGKARILLQEYLRDVERQGSMDVLRSTLLDLQRAARGAKSPQISDELDRLFQPFKGGEELWTDETPELQGIVELCRVEGGRFAIVGKSVTGGSCQSWMTCGDATAGKMLWTKEPADLPGAVFDCDMDEKRMFLVGRDNDGKSWLGSYGIDTGKESWRKCLGGIQGKGSLVCRRADERRLAVAASWDRQGPSSWLGVCDQGDGKFLWEKREADLPGHLNNFRILGKTVFVLGYSGGDFGKGPWLASFDVETGKPGWIKGPEALRRYASASVVSAGADGVWIGGVDSEGRGLIGKYDGKTGESRWEKGGLPGAVTLLKASDGALLCGDGDSAWLGCYGSGDGAVLWEKEPDPDLLSMAFVELRGKTAFACGTTKALQGWVACFDERGNPIWMKTEAGLLMHVSALKDDVIAAGMRIRLLETKTSGFVKRFRGKGVVPEAEALGGASR